MQVAEEEIAAASTRPDGGGPPQRVEASLVLRNALVRYDRGDACYGPPAPPQNQHHADHRHTTPHHNNNHETNNQHQPTIPTPTQLRYMQTVALAVAFWVAVRFVFRHAGRGLESAETR